MYKQLIYIFFFSKIVERIQRNRKKRVAVVAHLAHPSCLFLRLPTLHSQSPNPFHFKSHKTQIITSTPNSVAMVQGTSLFHLLLLLLPFTLILLTLLSSPLFRRRRLFGSVSDSIRGGIGGALVADHETQPRRYEQQRRRLRRSLWLSQSKFSDSVSVCLSLCCVCRLIECWIAADSGIGGADCADEDHSCGWHQRKGNSQVSVFSVLC